MHHRRSLLIASLFLGASCAGPAPAPQAPAAAGAPAAPAAPKTPAAQAAPSAPRASGKPEIRYYEIADA